MDKVLRLIYAVFGAQSDADATGNGSAIGIMKRLRTLLTLGTPVANGASSAAAAAAGTVIATTGALAAGTYLVEIAGSLLGVAAAGKGLLAVHRNAGDTADVAVLAACNGGGHFNMAYQRVTIATGERIVIRVGTVVLGAGEIGVASVRATPTY